MDMDVHITRFDWAGGPAQIGQGVANLARTAEAVGIKTLSVMDHFFQIRMIGPPEREMLEGYTTLAFVAGQTKRLKLGTMVTGVHYRHPGVLAKMVTSLDVLSGGRAWLGIGAGWNEDEMANHGTTDFKGRFKVMEERVRAMRETKGRGWLRGRVACVAQVS